MGNLTLAPADMHLRWKALEDRVSAAEGAMQEMLEVGKRADAEIEELRSALELAPRPSVSGEDGVLYMDWFFKTRQGILAKSTARELKV